MDKDPQKETAASPEAHAVAFWSANQRRPAFLLILTSGLILFLIWLPANARNSLFKAFLAQRGLVVLLILFALVTLSLIWSGGQRLDSRLFKLFNIRGYPLWLDQLMWMTTQLGNMLTAFAAAFVFFLFNDLSLSAEIVFGTLTLWLLVETIKALSDRERPYRILEGTRVIGWIEKGDSFPSGHTSQAFFLITLVIHRFPFGMIVIAALYTLAAIIAFTRIYVGAHYPRDVIAGVVLGSVWGILANLVYPYWLAVHF